MCPLCFLTLFICWGVECSFLFWFVVFMSDLDDSVDIASSEMRVGTHSLFPINIWCRQHPCHCNVYNCSLTIAQLTFGPTHYNSQSCKKHTNTCARYTYNQTIHTTIYNSQLCSSVVFLLYAFVCLVFVLGLQNSITKNSSKKAYAIGKECRRDTHTHICPCRETDRGRDRPTDRGRCRK